MQMQQKAQKKQEYFQHSAYSAQPDLFDAHTMVIMKNENLKMI